MPHFTKSVDGELRATIRVQYRVPKKIIDWLRGVAGLSYKEAWNRVRQDLFYQGFHFLDWRKYCYHDKYGLSDCSLDDVDSYKEDGWEICL